jgi:hypothetical protein
MRSATAGSWGDGGGGGGEEGMVITSNKAPDHSSLAV